MGRSVITPALILAVVQVLTGGLLTGSFGYYLDDWWFSDNYYRIAQPSASAIDRFDLFEWNGDVRALRFLLLGTQTVLIRQAGVPAACWLQILVEWSVSVFLFCLIRRTRGEVTAWIITCLFVLSPLDTTLLWLATFHWRVSLALVLAALLLVPSRFRLLSPALLLAAALVNEGPAPMYLMGVLWPSRTDKGSPKRFIVGSCLMAGTIYMLWRFVLFPAISVDIRTGMVLSQAPAEIIARMALNYLLGGYIFFVSAWRFTFDTIVRHTIMSISVIGTGMLAGSVLIAWMSRRSGQLDRFMEHLPSITWTIQNLVLGYFLSYWTGIFWYAGHQPGGDTRMNYPANIPFAFWILLAAMLTAKALNRLRVSRAIQGGFVIAAIMLACSAFMARAVRTQMDYRAAWRQQVRFVEQLAVQTEPLPFGSLIVLDLDPQPPLAIQAFHVSAHWHLESLVLNFIKPGMNLIFRDNIQQARLTGSGGIRLFTRSGRITAPPGAITFFRWTGEDLKTLPSALDCLIFQY
ncbi:hypothetical protein JXA40_03160 [bacterium]|nr:hypothetical protein [candidate division CSSED10-310 bacterium]